MTDEQPVAISGLSDAERERWLAFLTLLDQRMSAAILRNPKAAEDATVFALSMLVNVGRDAPDRIYLQLRGIAGALGAARAWVEDGTIPPEEVLAELLGSA